MKITIVTLFPEFFDSFKNTSIIKRALDAGRVEFETVDFRLYTKDKHNHVDDTPCGGGAGMVLSVQPIADCLRDICSEKSHVIMMTPQGERFKQQKARQLVSEHEHIVFVCGHYEGFDERIRDYVDEEISLGDFVLTGGEGAAMVISDALIRLMNGVILQESHEDDSFENGLLEYPQYTRPVEFEGKRVPDVLLSGHHANIKRWRLKESLRKTLERRPDLLEHRQFSKEEQQLMLEIKAEKSVE